MTFPSKLSDMRNKALQILPTIERAVEIYATEPEVTHQQVADTLGINFKMLMKIRRDPNFWAKVYDHYMVTFEGDGVNVLKAAWETNLQVRPEKDWEQLKGRSVIDE